MRLNDVLVLLLQLQCVVGWCRNKNLHSVGSQCYRTGDGYAVSWATTGDGLRVVFDLRHRLPANSWTAVAFGRSMQDLDAVIVKLSPTGRIWLNEYTITGYSASDIVPKAIDGATIEGPAVYQAGVLVVQFSVPTPVRHMVDGCSDWAFAAGRLHNTGAILKHDAAPKIVSVCNLWQCAPEDTSTSSSTSTTTTSTTEREPLTQPSQQQQQQQSDRNRSLPLNPDDFTFVNADLYSTRTPNAVPPLPDLSDQPPIGPRPRPRAQSSSGLMGFVPVGELSDTVDSAVQFLSSLFSDNVNEGESTTVARPTATQSTTTTTAFGGGRDGRFPSFPPNPLKTPAPTLAPSNVDLVPPVPQRVPFGLPMGYPIAGGARAFGPDPNPPSPPTTSQNSLLAQLDLVNDLDIVDQLTTFIGSGADFFSGLLPGRSEPAAAIRATLDDQPIALSPATDNSSPAASAGGGGNGECSGSDRPWCVSYLNVVSAFLNTNVCAQVDGLRSMCCLALRNSGCQL